MRTDTPQAIQRKDYTPPNHLVDTVEMGFDLEPGTTTVATRLTMRRNPLSRGGDIELLGDGVTLVQLRMDGKPLGKRDYRLEGGNLRIPNAPEQFTLEIETRIHPDQNSSLSGLYTSNGNFFTQCEAEGFRRITFFPDRPDVMAKYTVMLRADKARYPVLLSNGNLVEEGDLGDGRHYAKWEDPFKKPSYLFALVAARLVCLEEDFVLQSGRKVLLQVWVEEGNLDKTQHAMESLKKSIRWDEQRYGLELDLDRFMIVATSDFNMGAMENKGLNIFNTKCVLASPRISTDTDYFDIESVVAHEYFHNWTGNRVTCRDWFQLSLKEGLTVFRDQEFSSDMAGSESARAVCRIQAVRALRQAQFPEDAGTMAHPVRPDSYFEINNFYTATVYNKGAEVVRMMQTLCGVGGFRRGMDLYFQRHDGQAVECDDFRAAMGRANDRNLKQFERWYSQAGTPRVRVKTNYNKFSRTYDITLTQSCPPTPGQDKKMAMHIPVAVGLLDTKGRDIPLTLDPDTPARRKMTVMEVSGTVVLELTKNIQTFGFEGIDERPVPSLLRNFSAPVILLYDYSDEDLLHLFRHDSDAFNRWDAGQRLATQRMLKLVAALQAKEALELDSLFIEAMRATLTDASLDPAFRALALTLPSEQMVAEEMAVVDPHAIHQARRFMCRSIAGALRAELLAAYEANQTPGPYSPESPQAGPRALKNRALAYLSHLQDDTVCKMAMAQFTEAAKPGGNMTDHIAALEVLANIDPKQAGKANAALGPKALQTFHKDMAGEALAIDKWFSLQAAADGAGVAEVRELMRHPAFTLKNPNRARSVVGTFCMGNPVGFHAPDGSGYAFWAEQVIALSAINPQIAGRIARAMDRWRKFGPEAQAGMEAALKQVAAAKNLCGDVAEIVGKALAAPAGGGEVAELAEADA